MVEVYLMFTTSFLISERGMDILTSSPNVTAADMLHDFVLMPFNWMFCPPEGELRKLSMPMLSHVLANRVSTEDLRRDLSDYLRQESARETKTGKIVSNLLELKLLAFTTRCCVLRQTICLRGEGSVEVVSNLIRELVELEGGSNRSERESPWKFSCQLMWAFEWLFGLTRRGFVEGEIKLPSSLECIRPTRTAQYLSEEALKSLMPSVYKRLSSDEKRELTAESTLVPSGIEVLVVVKDETELKSLKSSLSKRGIEINELHREYSTTTPSLSSISSFYVSEYFNEPQLSALLHTPKIRTKWCLRDIDSVISVTSVIDQMFQSYRMLTMLQAFLEEKCARETTLRPSLLNILGVIRKCKIVSRGIFTLNRARSNLNSLLTVPLAEMMLRFGTINIVDVLQSLVSKLKQSFTEEDKELIEEAYYLYDSYVYSKLKKEHFLPKREREEFWLLWFLYGLLPESLSHIRATAHMLGDSLLLTKKYLELASSLMQRVEQEYRSMRSSLEFIAGVSGLTWSVIGVLLGTLVSIII